MHTRRRANALVGCLIAIAVVLIILAIGAWFVATNWRGWVASGVNETTVAFIEQSDLPEDEKPEMIAHINDYTQSFEAGDVTVEQFTRTLENLDQSPLIPVGMLYSIIEGYIKPSELDPETKDQGERALQRVARGIQNGTLEPTVVEEVAAPIGSSTPEGDFRLDPKPEVTDDMLREVIASARTTADEAQIPDEPYVVDLSDELEEILERTPEQGNPEAETQPEAEPEP